jgi:hypothetical protein
MEKIEFKNRLRKFWKRIGYSFLAMVFVDYLLLKIFGESPETNHTFGWYLFIIWTLLCGLALASWLFLSLFIILFSYVNREKEKEKDSL